MWHIQRWRFDVPFRKMHLQEFLSWTIVIFQISSISASHFRGGVITWKPGDIENEIIVSFKLAWRRSYGTNTFCDSDTISKRQLIGTNEYIQTKDSYYGDTMGTTTFYCTSYSEREDWTQGGKTFNYTFTKDREVHHFGFSGNAWIYLMRGGGGNWFLQVAANLTRRSDTGRINSSPITTMQPILRLQHGCNHTVKIPVNDLDGDIVRCRWCAGSNECGSVASSLRGYIDKDSCTLTYYSASYSPGYYAVAMQIEDFSSINSVDPRSSVPLQFLVVVTKSSNVYCSRIPTFSSPTPEEGACIGTPFGESLMEDIIAKSDNESSRITEITLSSPAGMTKTDLSPFGSTGDMWHIRITWTPTMAQKGVNLFCFTATDDNGVSSDQRCVSLVGGVSPPEIVKNALSPTGRIDPLNTLWTIQFDKLFVAPDNSRFVYFYKENGSLVHKVDVHGNALVSYPRANEKSQLQITTHVRLEEKTLYYILVDRGIVKSTTYCGVESKAITESSFWNFTTRDITPPTLTFLRYPYITNGTATFSWTFDEEVTVVCTIKSPNSTQKVGCQDTWTGRNLQGGQYRIIVEGRDGDNNSVSSYKDWKVDVTPPEIFMTSRPRNVSNHHEIIRFHCNESCRTVCSLHRINETATFSPCKVSYNADRLLDNSTYIFEVQATDHVGNTGYISISWMTDQTPPSFPPYLASQTMKCEELNIGKNVVRPNVTDVVDPTPSLAYNDTVSAPCTITRQWSATDYAGNTAQANQIIYINTNILYNVTFPDDAVVACGALDEITRSVFLPSIQMVNPCNVPVTIIYHDPPKAKNCGIQFTRTWEIVNSCGNNVIDYQYIQIQNLQNPIFPENGEIDVDLQAILIWPRYPGTQRYSLYVWKYGQNRSESVSYNTYSNSHRPFQLYNGGTKYLWQVEYYLTDDQIVYGPLWGFTTRNVSDLSIQRIEVPKVAFSGQSFNVRWTIRNVGNQMTPSLYWYDAVFVSFDNEFSRSRRAALVRHDQILFPGDTYTGYATVDLRDGDIGTLHTFVQTDYYKQMFEANEENNLRESLDPIEVKLTPPPDLGVALVDVPSSTYSANTIRVQYTITNFGLRSTGEAKWLDCVILSEDSFYNASDIILSRIRRDNILLANESYSVSTSALVPRCIYGSFYILVMTDCNKKVFEYNMEENNVGRSGNPIKVILTPPPDLKVASLDVGDEYVTGDSVNIQWTVINDGFRTPYTNTWIDNVAIVSEEISLSFNRFVYMNLKPGQSYEMIQKFLIPSNVPTGTYNVTLTSDVQREVFEFKTYGNNEEMAQINVIQRLPDLSVSNVFVDIFSNLSNTLMVTWYVHNDGTGSTRENYWTDKISVVTSNYEFHQYARITETVGQQKEYSSKLKFVLPMEVFGNANVSITTDEFHELPDPNLRNNRKDFDHAINVPLLAPDLQIQSCNIISGDDISSGDDIKIELDVVNIGTNISSESWTDSVSLKLARDSFIIGQSLELGPLATGDTYTRTYSLHIPEASAGMFFFHCTANRPRSLFEGNRFGNNEKKMSVFVSTPPTADLVVTDFRFETYQDEELHQMYLSLYWEVTNQGNSLWDITEWTDAVAISHSSSMSYVRNNINRFVLEKFLLRSNLESFVSYTMNKTVPISQSFTGKYFAYLITDAQDDIQEVNAEMNNIFKGREAINLPVPHPPNVTVENVNISTERLESPSKILYISYTVKNVGGGESKTSWMDQVYAHKQNAVRGSDLFRNGIFLTTWTHIGALKPGDTYTVRTEARLPHYMSGDYFFYVIADDQRNISFYETMSEIHLTGNLKIDVPCSSKPNLFIEIDKNEAKQRGGQPTTINFTISNEGEVTITDSFFVSLYLSEDMNIDPFDHKLKTENIRDVIIANESIETCTEVFIPFDLPTKMYFLLLYVDSSSEIFEMDENDNVNWKPLFVSAKISTDVLVLDVTASDRVLYGEDIQVNWTLGNNGTKRAVGYKCDSVYLSKDRKWDIQDEQIGETQCGYFELDPTVGDNNAVYHLTADVPPISNSEYKALVKTRTNILDPNITNDIGSSENATTVLIATLPLESERIIPLGKVGHYQVHIPDVPSENALLITTIAEIRDTFYTVYVRYGRPATTYSFDRTISNPVLPEHKITIPNTKEGSYYVMVQLLDKYSSNIETMNVTLSAVIAKFEIQDTFPRSAAPVGNVTIKFQGSLFPEDTIALIYNDTFTLHAIQNFWFSSTLFYATFDVVHLAVGSNISLELFSKRLNESAVLSNGLNIIEGTPGIVTATIQSPESLVFGETGLVFVDVRNEGDTDIVAPFLVVTASSNSALKLLSNTEETNYIQTYHLTSGSSEGPSGILLPGENRRFEFEIGDENIIARRRSQIQVNLIKPDMEAEHFYMGLSSIVKQTEYTDDVWNKTWTNFLEKAGTTWFSLSRIVSEALNQFSRAGQRVEKLTDVVSYLLKEADGMYTQSYLTLSDDIGHGGNDDVELSLTRYMPYQVGQMQLQGPLGRGWILPLWETQIKDMSPVVVRLTLGRRDVLFFASSYGSYINTEYGQVLIETEAVRFIDWNTNLNYNFNFTTKTLQSVSSSRDKTKVTLKYNWKMQVTALEHSDGRYINISYDAIGHIKSAVHSSRFQSCFYIYNGMHYLTSVRCNEKSLNYSYNVRGILTRVDDVTGISDSFTYTKEGFVQSKVTSKGITIIRQETFHHSTGKLSVDIWPDNVRISYFFSPDGNICASKREASPIMQRTRTLFTETIFQGDIIITRKTYAKSGHAVRLEDGNMDSIEIGYNDQNQVQYFRDGDGNQYTIIRYQNDSLREVVYPDSSSEKYTYLSNGIIQTTRNNSRKVTYLDGKNRTVYKNNGQGQETILKYNDTDDRLTEISNENCNITLSYDRRVLPVTVCFDNKTTIKYSFNKHKLKSGISLPGENYNILYLYDEYNRLKHVVDKTDQTTLMTAEYNEKGIIQMKNFSNGASVLYAYYQDSGALKGIYNFLANGTMSSKFEYVYDFRQRRVQLNTIEGVWNFRYDMSGQVTYMKNPNGSETTFSYDARKNRKYREVDGFKEYYTTNVLNQYTDFKNGKSIKYDRNGNLVSKNGLNSRKFEFDEDNNLIKYKTDDSDCSLKYDPLGNLHRKDCSGYSSSYVVDPFGKDGSDVLMEVYKDGNETRRTYYIYGGDQLGLLAMKRDKDFYFYQFDPLGSVVAILSENGDVINSYNYNPFGEMYFSMESISNPFTFVGQWGVMHISEIEELFFMRARFYDAELGRYLSIDVLGINAGSKNFYVYVENNPVHFNDPNGRIISILLASAAKSLVEYGVESLIEGKELTFGGAAGAVAAGFIGGPLGKIGGKIVGKIGSKVLQTLGKTKVGRAIIGEASKFGGKAVKALSRFAPELPKPFKAFVKKIAGNVRDDMVNELFNSGYPFDIDLTEDIKKAVVQSLPKPIQNLLKIKHYFENLDKAVDGAKNLYNKMKSEVDNLIDDASNLLDRYPNIKDGVQRGLKALTNDIQALEDAAKKAGEDLQNDYNEFMKEIMDWIDKLKSELLGLEDELENEIADAFDQAKAAMDNATAALEHLADNVVEWVRSHDPNDIQGPLGFGAARFISPTTNLTYKIRFENDQNASAPAQRVVISMPIDSHLDPKSFRIGMIGFGSFVRNYWHKQSVFQETIDFTESRGVFVRMRGGLDIVNNKVTWEIQALNPNTGFPPDDPMTGFLPPNNGTTGQGFVSFSIKTKDSIPNLSKIEAKAVIYFDQNAPMDTPTIFNTMDNLPPEVNISIVNQTLSSGILAVSISTEDSESGSAFVDLYLKTEHGYSLLLSGVTDPVVTLPLPPGHNYEIAPVAVDNVGNRSPLAGGFREMFLPEVQGSCLNNCSNHGRCSEINVCICEIGFYGAECNEGEPLIEPPVIEHVSTQQNRSNINVYVMLKNAGRVSPDDMYVKLTGFPEGSNFSKGIEENQTLIVNASDFGYIDFQPPTNFSGNVELHIEAVSKKNTVLRQRRQIVNIFIGPGYDTYTTTENVNGEAINTVKGSTYRVGNDTDHNVSTSTTVNAPSSTTVKQSTKSSNNLIAGAIGGSFAAVFLFVFLLCVLSASRRKKTIKTLQPGSQYAPSDAEPEDDTPI